MSNKSAAWISPEVIQGLLTIEPAILIFSTTLMAWVVFHLIKKRLQPQRLTLFKDLFKDLRGTFFLAVALFAAYQVILPLTLDSVALVRLSVYVGLLALATGAISFVKTARILAFEYLFLGHMREGVPVLIVNLLTLLLSLTLGGWFVTEVFGLKLGPLLATSAILSVVLGLALQDTLGNLFAGVALTFDKPYEIGDWIEIHTGSAKWAGQVNEITWRATLLIGMGDETMIVPNRVVAQAEISNFSSRFRPFIRAQMYRIPYGSNVEKAKRVLTEAARSAPRVRTSPAPLTFIAETTESWITLRLIFFIEDYGSQFTIGDAVAQACLQALAREGIELASPRIEVSSPSSELRREPS